MSVFVAAAMLLTVGTIEQTRPSTDLRALEVMRDFAACVVKRNPDEANNVLQMDFRSEEYPLALRKLALKEKRCLTQDRANLQFGGLLFAGGMAEAVLLNETGDAPFHERLLPVERRPAPRGANEALVFCVVDAAPQQVTDVLRSVPGDEAESTAIAALLPALSSCMNEDEQASLNSRGMRSLLALAAYRLTRPQPGGN
ncbi:hypothetical protein [Sphingomonas sp.]